MQAASQSYKDHMKAKDRLRNQTYIRVTIGLINQEAQASAYIPDQENYTYYSSFKRPLDNYEVQELYAACDQNYTSVDGSMYFLPRNRADVVLNQGIVSEGLMGPVEIRFPVQHDIKGLTVEFGKAFPVDFTIESDKNIVEIAGNTDGHFVTEEIFNGTTFLRFTPLVMVNGHSRFRIHKITMGIGIYFDNQRILSATKKEHISPTMEELPTIDFNLKVNNKDRAFDIENEESSVNFLEIGQEITVLYGQELDDGSMEWLPGATVQLKEWSADDEEMNFSASDRFDYMDGTYYKGLYRPEGISLYDLALNVLSDAGIDSRTYWIDSYLKSVKVSNPMPVVSHKEALQLIANAGRCILYQDREGNIFLKSSFIPDIKANSDNETYFSRAESVLGKAVKKSYALTSRDYTRATNVQYFLPKKQTLRYSPNANGSPMTETRQPDSKYVGVGYMPREILEHENLVLDSTNIANNFTIGKQSGASQYAISEISVEGTRGVEIETIKHETGWVFGSYPRNLLNTDKIDSSDVLTLSFDIKQSNTMGTTAYMSTNAQNKLFQWQTPTDVSNTWYKYSSTASKIPSIPVTAQVLYFSSVGNGWLKVDGATVQLKNLKLEKGTEATPWTPAPSDWLADPGNYTWVPIEEYKTPLYLNTGYVSESVAEGDGSFVINPTVEIKLEASFKCFGLTLEFGGNNPSQMVFHAYKDGILVEDYMVTDLTATTVISHEFEEFDRLLLEFIKGHPNNRVVLNNITLGDSTDYIFEYGHELTKTPKGTQLAKVRELQMIRTLYNQSGEMKELAKETIAVTATDNRYTFYFNNPSYDLSCALTAPGEGQTATIIDSSNYFATVEITGVTGTVEVSVSGRECTTVKTKLSRQLNPTGSVEIWENPLVSDAVHAADLADWIGDYLKSDRQYDLQYRGEPRIDANDIAFLENKYVPDLLLRVYEHTLKFNGALSGSVKARRDMSNVATAKD